MAMAYEGDAGDACGAKFVNALGVSLSNWQKWGQLPF